MIEVGSTPGRRAGARRVPGAMANRAPRASRLRSAFGEVISETGTWPDEVPFGYQTNWLAPPGLTLPDGTQLYLTKTRVYDPREGRFLQRDFRRTPGENAYVYARNDPVNMVDPRGLQPDVCPPDLCDKTDKELLELLDAYMQQLFKAIDRGDATGERTFWREAERLLDELSRRAKAPKVGRAGPKKARPKTRPEERDDSRKRRREWEEKAKDERKRHDPILWRLARDLRFRKLAEEWLAIHAREKAELWEWETRTRVHKPQSWWERLTSGWQEMEDESSIRKRHRPQKEAIEEKMGRLVDQYEYRHLTDAGVDWIRAAMVKGFGGFGLKGLEEAAHKTDVYGRSQTSGERWLKGVLGLAELGAWSYTALKAVKAVPKAGRFFYDPRSFPAKSAEYWAAKGGAQGRALHHLMIPQQAEWVPQGIRNAGLNLLEMPPLVGVAHPTLSVNTWMGFVHNWGPRYAGQQAAASALEWGIRAGIPAVAGGVGYGSWQAGEWIGEIRLPPRELGLSF